MAESLDSVLKKTKLGYKSFTADISFSNSEKFDLELEKELADQEHDLKKQMFTKLI